VSTNNDSNRPSNDGGSFGEEERSDTNPSAPKEHQEDLAGTSEDDRTKAEEKFAQAEEESIQKTRALGRTIITKLTEGGIHGVGRWLVEQLLDTFDGDVG
jgi:hypothetical protein